MTQHPLRSPDRKEADRLLAIDSVDSDRITPSSFAVEATGRRAVLLVVGGIGRRRHP